MSLDHPPPPMTLVHRAPCRKDREKCVGANVEQLRQQTEAAQRSPYSFIHCSLHQAMGVGGTRHAAPYTSRHCTGLSPFTTTITIIPTIITMSAQFASQTSNGATTINGSMATTQPFVARAPVPVDPLEREAKEIDRRRARLEDRRQRILHAKTRLIGVDVDALDGQVRAKHRQSLEALAEDRYYESLTQCHAGQLTSLVNAKLENEAAARHQLAFHHQQQAAEKKSRDTLSRERARSPMNVETNFLNFTGEDLLYQQRLAQQKQQQREWATQQIEIKMAQEAKELMDDADYEATQAQYRELQRQNEERQMYNTIKTNESIANTNKVLAAEKCYRERVERQVDECAKQTELVNTFTDRFMVEDSQSRDGNRGYCFKGFTVEDRQAILDQQRQQQLELEQRRQQQTAEQRAYDNQQDKYRRQLILADIQQRQYQTKQRQSLSEVHERQAREKQARDRYLDAVVYTNPVKEEYFQQFGTSAR